MQYRNYWKMPAAAVLALSALLNGCGGGGSSQGVVNGVQFKVNSPAEIASTSADDYNNNTYGLITGTTLDGWINNWTANRPAGITGKLVILQVSAGPTGAEYIKSDGTNVFTYLTNVSTEWTETRSNGVIQTVSMLPEGALIDATLQKYNIDPTKDMVVIAMGNGNPGNAMSQGRVWFALRYWGVDKTHVGILSGGNQWLTGNVMPAGDFMATPNTAPANGTFTVKNLPVDNTQLQATLQDMINIVPNSDTNIRTDGVFIWDARTIEQYSAGEMLENGDSDKSVTPNVTCSSAYCTPGDVNNYMYSFQNSGSMQGHPNGSLDLNFNDLLDSTKGFSYKDKATLQAYINGEPDSIGRGFVDGSYNLVGAGNAYQPGDVVYTFCETSYRAMITGMASAVILGLPTRIYDGAMVEWHSLANLQNQDGNFILPADSPWRTDVSSLSFFRPALSSSLIAPRTITNAYATSANAIVNADRAYKTGESISTSSGAGGSLPSNPCGG
jgi:3-mercaptopyruvate sulfurtransferase SseA